MTIRPTPPSPMGPLMLTLLFRFNEAGLIASFRAEARGGMVGDKLVMAPWEGIWSDYRAVDGVQVPFTGEVAWMRPRGTQAVLHRHGHRAGLRVGTVIRKGRRIALVAGVAVLVLAVAAVWIGLRFDADMQQARTRSARGSTLVDTRCGPIEVQQTGTGVPLLVVHGSGGGHDQGMAFAGALASHGIRVIAMSRFGYLRTPMPPDGSAAAQADAHMCLLDALGIRRAAVMGGSAGAPLGAADGAAPPRPCRCADPVGSADLQAADAGRLGGARCRPGWRTR